MARRCRRSLCITVRASVCATMLQVVAFVPARALAQSASPRPSDTIEITAAPAPVEPEPPSASPAPGVQPPVQRTYQDDDEAFEDTGPVVAVRAPALVPPGESPAALASLWRRHLGLGATVGVGSPIGMFGAFVDVNVMPYLGVTLGGGAGGTFGPAVAGTVNIRPWRLGHFAPYLGVGLSTNFLGDVYRNNPSIHVPANAWWLDLELGLEYRSSIGLGLRLAAGFAPLLNTGDFTNVEYQNFYGPQSNTDVGWDPVSAADAHDAGKVLFVPYVHLDVFGLFNF